MATKKKLLEAAAGNAGGEALNVEEVFSTYLYTGNGSTQTITNGIDLAGEGGMVWIKSRDTAASPNIVDTERGDQWRLLPNGTTASIADSDFGTFTSSGFSLDGNNQMNTNASAMVSWTFRKAPKFFDVVTYTGNGTAGRTVSHNLGSVPGCIITKRTDSGSTWAVYHRGVAADAETDYLRLDTTSAAADLNTVWNDTAPTSTDFTLGSVSTVNASGGTYVAYLFAHNDGDGGFGPTGDQDIIKCGSFTTNANGDASIDLGFEPQWVLLKRTDAAQSWWLADTMRGMTVGTAGTAYLVPDQNYAEDSTYTNYINPTSTGFGVDAFSGSATYIYIAIRRGPMAVPESATDVFAITTQTGTVLPAHDTGFVTDFSLRRENALSSASIIHAVDRLRGTPYLSTEGTNAEISMADNTWDFMDGWYGATSDNSNLYAWSWKRAPSFFDVVAYTGNGTAGRTVSHNLGVAPEMMWVKVRSTSQEWMVYHKDIGATHHLSLDRTDASSAQTNVFNNTEPTDSVFSLGNSATTNSNGSTYIAYLFASLAGVSKVGSYTGNGTSQTIDCGFNSGARFVLIKRTDSTGDWYIWDTERGIVAGNDPYLELNTTGAEVTNTDWVDPDSSGFIVNGTTINASSAEYIFYAVA